MDDRDDVPATPADDVSDPRTDAAPATHARALTRVARLVVPVALAVTAVSLAATAVTSTVGCGDDSPADANLHDTGPDTPII